MQVLEKTGSNGSQWLFRAALDDGSVRDVLAMTEEAARTLLQEVLSNPPAAYHPPSPEEVAAAERLTLFPNLEPDQFWFGLRAAGYEADVRGFVNSLNDPESPNYSPVDWASASAKLEFAKYFERDHPLVLAAQQAIGISEGELDALWQFAAFG